MCEDDAVLFSIGVQGNFSKVIIVGGFQLTNKTNILKNDRINKQ